MAPKSSVSVTGDISTKKLDTPKSSVSVTGKEPTLDLAAVHIQGKSRDLKAKQSCPSSPLPTDLAFC